MTIEIISARFGVPSSHIGVTARVAAIMQESNGDIEISIEAMGVGPAVGHVKQLNVVYLYNGVPQTLSGTESSTITLSPKERVPGVRPSQSMRRSARKRVMLARSLIMRRVYWTRVQQALDGQADAFD